LPEIYGPGAAAPHADFSAQTLSAENFYVVFISDGASGSMKRACVDGDGLMDR